MLLMHCQSAIRQRIIPPRRCCPREHHRTWNIQVDRRFGGWSRKELEQSLDAPEVGTTNTVTGGRNIGRLLSHLVVERLLLARIRLRCCVHRHPAGRVHRLLVCHLHVSTLLVPCLFRHCVDESVNTQTSIMSASLLVEVQLTFRCCFTAHPCTIC